MQALERTIVDTNWVTVLLVVLLVCVFLLKGLSFERLKGNALSLINKTFIESEIEENYSFVNLFKIVVFIFSMTVISLLMYKFLLFFDVSKEGGFYIFMKTLGVVFSYFSTKRLVEFLLSHLFKINEQLKFFLGSKSNYLNCVSFYVFIALVIVEYSPLNTLFLVYISVLFFSIRFVLHLISNKKLISSKLFYFILYLCSFEIAPPFILFKLLF